MQIYDFFVNSRPHFLMFHLIFFVLLPHSLRRIWSRKYKIKTAKKFSHKDVSFVVPIYKEDPKIVEKVLERAKANNPREILICIDGLTPELSKVACKYGKVIKGENKGKIGALAKSVRKSDNDSKFIAFLDSDTFLFDDKTLAITLTGFYDQKIVGVMGERAIYPPKGIAGTFSLIHELTRNVVESGLATDDYLSVVDGRFMVWRRNFLIMVVDEFEKSEEKVADDALLTFLAYKYGYKTYWVKGSKISTLPQPSLTKYFKQQIRWARTGYSFYWRYIKFPISWKNKLHQTFYLFEPFSFFTALFFDLFVFYPLPFFRDIFLPLFLVFGTMLYTILSQIILYDKPVGLKYLLQLSLIGYFILFPIKIYSALTRNAKTWLTRN